MKKILFGIATFVLLLGAAGCKKETIETAEDGKNNLKFTTALGKQTLSRATEFTAWESGDELLVAAYKAGETTAAYPTNPIELDFDGTVWTPATPVASLGTTVRYYSVYNDGATLPTGDPQADSYEFDYTVEDAAADQNDLIVAETTTAGTLVALQFRHVLSQVNFSLVQTPGMEITIDEISLANINAGGTYTMGGDTPGWSALNTTAAFEYPLTGGSVTTDGVASGLISLKDDDLENSLMLIPHTFDDASTAELRVTFDLVQDGDDDIITDKEAVILLKDCNVTEWQEGKRYVYEFDFSSYIRTGEITFTVSVAPWEDADPISSTIEVAAPNLPSIERAIALLSEANAGNTDLGVFTISVPEDVTAMLPALTMIPGFDAGDVIHIEFTPTTTIGYFQANLDPAYWTVASDGRVVTLTCVAPMQIADEVAATIETPVTKDTFEAGINAAIATQAAADTAEATLTMFPITVGDDLAELWTITMPDAFEAGDRIRIEFTGPGGPDTVGEFGSVAGWTAAKTGNVLLLTKDAPVAP